MRDPEKYSWADGYRQPRNTFSGPQLLLVSLVCTGGAIVWLWGCWELWRLFVRALLS